MMPQAIRTVEVFIARYAFDLARVKPVVLLEAVYAHFLLTYAACDSHMVPCFCANVSRRRGRFGQEVC